ncbi:MAG TPA: Wzz/FepE/Etk N-terminal domain-containing protein, partial [Tepidisphaeraceae bacterium]|nr:Wzz/FepE/Etk N-terminal domain-containing protein [Tepidisphaeraceae bacterium]
MNGKKDKVPSDAIQRMDHNLPVGTINTPNGPALIQIIDVGPSNLGPVGYAGGGSAAAKPAGINILGAVLRRWWLVLLVAMVVGGGGILAANRLVAPTYEADALVLYVSMQSAAQNQRMVVASDPADIVRTHMELLTKPEISLKAAAKPELQQALPWLRGLDLQDPAVDKMVVNKLRGICEAIQVKSTPELVQIHTEKPDPFVAAAVVNAFADAFVEHCAERVMGRDGVRRRKLDEQVKEQEALMEQLNKAKAELMQKNDFDLQNARKAGIAQEFLSLQSKRTEAQIRAMAAKMELAKYKSAPDEKALQAQFQLELKKRIEEEKGKDSLLQAA